MDKLYAQKILNKTREDYNLIAEDFSRTRQNLWAELNIFKDIIKDNNKVLDAGCGNGRLLELFKDKKIEYTGIDISENLIKIAKESHPEINFLVADNLNLPFSDNSFDKVFSIAVLHTIPSRELRSKVLLEIKRVLKPEGNLILTVWDIKNKEKIKLFFKTLFFKLLGRSKLDFGDALVSWADKTERYYHFFKEKELYGVVEKTGFKIIRKGFIKGNNQKRSNIFVICQKK